MDYWRDDKEVQKLFKDFDQDYEFISKADLDDAILEGKEFYYLRYVRINAERFLSKTIAKSKKKLAK